MSDIVSVMLPTFARRKGGYLERAIQSVLRQTYNNFELLIIDDGSTDGSADLINTFCQHDSRVRHIRHERNIGLPALTLGLAYPQIAGTRIAFIFDDCAWMPSHLERLGLALDSNPNAVMAYGQAEAISDTVGSIVIGRPFDAHNMRIGNNHIPNVSVMLTRDAVETYGWYDPHVLLKRFCDWDLWARIGLNSTPVYVPEILAREEGTRLKTSLGNRVTVFRELMLRYAKTYRNFSLSPKFLAAYDPFNMEILPDLSREDRLNLEYLICEHFISVGRAEELLARPEYKDVSSKVELQARYLERRLEIISRERNEIQHALLLLEQQTQVILRERDEAKSTLFSSEQQAQIVSRERDEAKSALFSSEQQAQIVSRERDEAKSALVALEHQTQTTVAGLRNDLNKASQTAAREGSRAAAAEEGLRQVWASTSWRVTRPLRAVRRVLKGEMPFQKVGQLSAPIGRPLETDHIASGDRNASHTAIDAKAVSAKRSRPLQIIAIGDATASTEMCVQLPLEWMTKQFGVGYALYDQHLPPSPQNVLDADALILMRCHTHACVELVRHAHDSGVPVFYITDDDLEALTAGDAKNHQLGELIKTLKESRAVENVYSIAKMADRVIVFSQALQKRFSPLAKTYIAPAFSGVEWYDSQPIPQRPVEEREEIRIGYSGSLSHDRDVAYVIPVLDRLLKKYPNLFIETIGQRFKALSGHPRYRAFDYVGDLRSYIALQQNRSWDIGLAPLEETVFNEAKSDNKYRFYGAAGIPAVYTRFASFKSVIVDEDTGILVENNEDAWETAIERLILEPELRKEIAINAKNDVRERFGLGKIALQYMRWLSEISEKVRVLGVGYLHLPTVHIDLRLPFAEMKRAGNLSYRFREVGAASAADLDWADVLVVVRAVGPEIASLVREAKARGVKVIFSWDDDFFSIPKEHADLHAYYERKDIKNYLESMLREADLIKASTAPIAQRSLNYNTHVMTAPYGFDFSLLPGELAPRTDSRIRIGYFGSIGRGSEFDCVIEALRNLCKKHASVDLEFFGFAPKNMEALPRVTFFPFSDDYEGSIAALARRRWDIGLAPLTDNALNRAKLPTKYRDYGATHVAGVYSDIESYSAVVQGGRTGLLVKNTAADWFEALDQLVSKPDLRKAISEAAFQDVRERFSLDVAIDAWNEAFGRVRWNAS